MSTKVKETISTDLEESLEFKNSHLSKLKTIEIYKIKLSTDFQ
jgi:hypothetical protein